MGHYKHVDANYDATLPASDAVEIPLLRSFALAVDDDWLKFGSQLTVQLEDLVSLGYLGASRHENVIEACFQIGS